MPRLFVACDLPEDVRGALLDVRTELSGARWTPAAQIHLTLRFLGDTPEERLSALQAALSGCRSDALDLRIDGLTTFPSRRRPRVLVARVADDAGARLVALQQQIEQAVVALGFAPDQRPFSPHVTLARFKRPDPAAVRRLVRACAGLSLPFRVTAFHLYESTLHPDGAVHERRAACPLAP